MLRQTKAVTGKELFNKKGNHIYKNENHRTCCLILQCCLLAEAKDIQFGEKGLFLFDLQGDQSSATLQTGKRMGILPLGKTLLVISLNPQLMNPPI
jgi:hypothetical protein